MSVERRAQKPGRKGGGERSEAVQAVSKNSGVHGEKGEEKSQREREVQGWRSWFLKIVEK